ncbi:sorting assembly machinery 35 kDa subunit [[Candida] railenensis]|uniref:Sorting assembly machinery 35 kDa subunit n=1 Tax=[Candida] railenensis TaxID=45579 RepID=A0A9P0VZ73_9ASCO|nr:sorting assembly machinery 35 kDa subunit [[Candida] railenensis]
MEVPQALRQVFDSFPLKTYPSITASTSSQLEVLEARKFYFTSSSKTTSLAKSSSIILGINNVVEYRDIILPSDPVSLSQCLIICHKNGLKLPLATRKGITDENASNCLMTLSHQAAPDSQLPILIEDNKKNDGGEPIRSLIPSYSIVNSNKKDLSDSSDILINDMMDTKLIDLWLTCLMVDPNVNPPVLSKIFTLESFPSVTSSLSGLYISALLQDIPRWRSYEIRHSNLFRNSKLKDTITSVVRKSDNSALQAFYIHQLSEVRDLLELISDYVLESDCMILKMKLTGFLLSVDLILYDTELGKIIKQCSYLEKAYSNI